MGKGGGWECKKGSQVWGPRWEEHEEGVLSKGNREKQRLRAGVRGNEVRCSPSLAPQPSRWSSFRMAPSAPPSRACGLPELPWTFPATGPNPVLSHQQFPKEQIFIVLGRKKKSPLLGSGSGSCY